MSKKALVAVVGAGPIGIELAIALKQAKITYFQFDKGQTAQMIFNFPPQTYFFSSTERIGIAGIPIQTIDQGKCSREQYLAYLRSVVMQYQLVINTYEEVINIERLQSDDFQLTTKSLEGEKQYQVRYLVLATGGTSYPRLLGVPGEDLPHVSTKLEDPHKYFQKNVLIIGAKNSAAESALRCYHAGAKASLAIRKAQIESQDVKYWVLPELLQRIQRKEIGCFYQAPVESIMRDRVVLKRTEEPKTIEVQADFVIKTIGFQSDMRLFHQLGVPLSPEQESPIFDEQTMETAVPGVFVLGTVVGGTQKKYKVFIENTHIHVAKIMNSLCRKLGLENQWAQAAADHAFRLRPGAQLEE